MNDVYRTVVDNENNCDPVAVVTAKDGWEARQKVEQSTEWREKQKRDGATKWFPRYEVRESTQQEVALFVLSCSLGKEIHWLAGIFIGWLTLGRMIAT